MPGTRSGRLTVRARFGTALVHGEDLRVDPVANFAQQLANPDGPPGGLALRPGQQLDQLPWRDAPRSDRERRPAPAIRERHGPERIQRNVAGNVVVQDGSREVRRRFQILSKRGEATATSRANFREEPFEIQPDDSNDVVFSHVRLAITFSTNAATAPAIARPAMN
jgi:hypothetical protein